MPVPLPGLGPRHLTSGPAPDLPNQSPHTCCPVGACLNALSRPRDRPNMRAKTRFVSVRRTNHASLRIGASDPTRPRKKTRGAKTPLINDSASVTRRVTVLSWSYIGDRGRVVLGIAPWGDAARNPRNPGGSLPTGNGRTRVDTSRVPRAHERFRSKSHFGGDRPSDRSRAAQPNWLGSPCMSLRSRSPHGFVLTRPESQSP
jgi:hypothetical protein